MPSYAIKKIQIGNEGEMEGAQPVDFARLHDHEVYGCQTYNAATMLTLCPEKLEFIDLFADKNQSKALAAWIESRVANNKGASLRIETACGNVLCHDITADQMKRLKEDIDRPFFKMNGSEMTDKTFFEMVELSDSKTKEGIADQVATVKARDARNAARYAQRKKHFKIG